MASKALVESVFKVFNNSKTPVPKTLAKSAVDSVFAAIGTELLKTGRFAHPGIGIFRVKYVLIKIFVTGSVLFLGEFFLFANILF